MTKGIILGALNCLLGIINISLFVLWWGLIKVSALPTPPEAAFYIDSISSQIAILDVMIAAVTIFLAVAAFVGYNAIRNAAESKAEETAKETAKKVADEIIARFIQNTFSGNNQAQFSPNPVLGPVNTTAPQAQPITNTGGTTP